MVDCQMQINVREHEPRVPSADKVDHLTNNSSLTQLTAIKTTLSGAACQGEGLQSPKRSHNLLSRHYLSKPIKH